MINYCLEHWRNIRTCPGKHYLPVGHRRRRGFVEFVDLDDDSSDDLGDGEGWAEVAGGSDQSVSMGGGGANK